MSDLQSALAAAERVFHLMDEIPEPEDAKDAMELGGAGQPVQGEVELSHVDFGYEADKIILHDLSLKAQPGKLVAIVGPTGAGKTTRINLLMRFYDASAGTITVDGLEAVSYTHLDVYKRQIKSSLCLQRVSRNRVLIRKLVVGEHLFPAGRLLQQFLFFPLFLLQRVLHLHPEALVRLDLILVLRGGDFLFRVADFTE